MNHHIFQASLAVFLIMVAGGVLRRFRWMTPEADSTLLALAVNFLYPCLIISKTFKTDLSTYFHTLWMFPTSGFFIVIASVIVAMAFARLPVILTGLHDKRQQRTFVACVSMFNYGFLPIPLVTLLAPGNNELLTLLMVFNLGVEFALWTCIVPLLAGGLEPGWWKQMLRIPLVAILFALFGNLLGLPAYVPPFVMHAMNMLGESQIPLSLLMVGAIIYDELVQKARVMRKRDATKIVAGTLLMRAVVLPAVMVAVAYVLHHHAGMQDSWLPTIIVIQAGMPCGMMTIMFARAYNGSPSVAVRSVLSSSVASLVTVVFWISLGMWLIGADFTAL